MILQKEEASFLFFWLLHWQEKGSKPMSKTSLNIDNEFPQSITVFIYNFSVYIHILTLLIENCKTPEHMYIVPLCSRNLKNFTQPSVHCWSLCCLVEQLSGGAVTWDRKNDTLVHIFKRRFTYEIFYINHCLNIKPITIFFPPFSSLPPSFVKW